MRHTGLLMKFTAKPVPPNRSALGHGSTVAILVAPKTPTPGRCRNRVMNPTGRFRARIAARRPRFDRKAVLKRAIGDCNCAAASSKPSRTLQIQPVLTRQQPRSLHQDEAQQALLRQFSLRICADRRHAKALLRCASCLAGWAMRAGYRYRQPVADAMNPRRQANCSNSAYYRVSPAIRHDNCFRYCRCGRRVPPAWTSVEHRPFAQNSDHCPVPAGLDQLLPDKHEYKHGHHNLHAD